MWGLALQWERTSDCILQHGKPSDPSWVLGKGLVFVPEVKGGLVFVGIPWIGSKRSVHRFSLPTVVASWNECVATLHRLVSEPGAVTNVPCFSL